MNWDHNYKEWKRRVRAEGKAEGILMVLQKRGVTVSATQAEQISNCQDAAQLDAWLLAAITTTDVAAMLAVCAPSKARRRSSTRAA